MIGEIPKEEVCKMVCKYCVQTNGFCQHRWDCPLLTEIAKYDRKTESSSEKPNNSTISKMEQVEDEPKGLCKICMNYPCGYWDEDFITHNHSVRECRAFEPKDEPQTHEIRTNTHECVKDTHDEDEPQKERPRRDAAYIMDCIDLDKKVAEAVKRNKEEQQTDCQWK